MIEPHSDPAEEMRYFMAVATAAAYCKARDRRGRIDAKTIRGLLEDTYLEAARWVISMKFSSRDGRSGSTAKVAPTVRRVRTSAV